MAECCERRGAWRFCPWCGRSWAAPAPDNRHDALSLPRIARMRKEGLTWKAIGASFGYSSGQNVVLFVNRAYREWYESKNPPIAYAPSGSTQEENRAWWAWYGPMRDKRLRDAWLLEQADG